MSERNEAELIRLLEKAAEFSAEQHRIIRELCTQFVALSTAVTPVVMCCEDEDIALQFKADLVRINGAVQGMLQRAEQLH